MDFIHRIRQDFSNYKRYKCCLFCFSGEIVNAVVYSYTCKHDHTAFANNHPISYFPSYHLIINNGIKERRFTQQHIIKSKYMYLGGHYAFETSVLQDYLILFAIGAITIYAFVDVYNFKHRLLANDNLKLDRKLFTRTILSFALIHFLFFMGYSNIHFPYVCSGENLDIFFYQYQRIVHVLFVHFWSQHKRFSSCGTHCSQMIIGDGNQKIRRLICRFHSLVTHSIFLPHNFIILFINFQIFLFNIIILCSCIKNRCFN